MAENENRGDRVLGIHSKLSQINDKLWTIAETQAKHTVILDEHIKRTELNERRIEHVEALLGPVKTHVSNVEGALKLLGLLGVILSAIVSIFKLLGK